MSGKYILTLVHTRAVSSQLETTPAQWLPSASGRQTSVTRRRCMRFLWMSVTFARILEKDTRVAAICEHGRCSGTMHLDSGSSIKVGPKIDTQHPLGPCGDLQGSPQHSRSYMELLVLSFEQQLDQIRQVLESCSCSGMLIS